MLNKFETQIKQQIDLSLWGRSSAEMKIKFIDNLFLYSKNYFSFDTDLHFQMPQGYENAFGLYDPILHRLYVNPELMDNSNSMKALFYFLHELRHAIQYEKNELFSQEIQKSLSYVIQYNGLCFKLENQCWKSCFLDGEESYFTELYLSLPYELDANQFALRCIETIAQTDELEQLRHLWLPKYKFFSTENAWSILNKTFEQIEREV